MGIPSADTEFPVPEDSLWSNFPTGLDRAPLPIPLPYGHGVASAPLPATKLAQSFISARRLAIRSDRA